MLLLLQIVCFFAVTIALITFIRRYKKHLKKKAIRLSHETWAIGIFEGKTPFALQSLSIKNPILTAQDVTDVPARFVADPFMLQDKDNIYYLFFEVLNKKRNLGEIGYASSKDLHHWQYHKIVLRTRHHLSYPYVFYADGNYYMIPECYKSKGIQLYQAKKFPEDWEWKATIIKREGNREAFVDTSIIQYNGVWYLFSYGKHRSLHLFFASNVIGPWKEHPKSPVITGSSQYARPGGRVIEYAGHLYRYAQDEIPHYGAKVWAFRITTLNETEYSEELFAPMPIVQASNESWNKSGMHHIDPHQKTTGEWYAFVDGFTIQ